MRQNRELDFEKVKRLHAQGLTERILAERFGVSKAAIHYAVNEGYRQHCIEKKRKAKTNGG